LKPGSHSAKETSIEYIRCRIQHLKSHLRVNIEIPIIVGYLLKYEELAARLPVITGGAKTNTNNIIQSLYEGEKKI
jgi:hypothetical protein